MRLDPFPYEATFLVAEHLAARLSGSIDLKVISCGELSLQREGWRTMVLGFLYFDVARTWVLQYGGAVEVLAPDPLRLSVIDFAQQTLEVYEQS
jgi:hypothetical protein